MLKKYLALCLVFIIFSGFFINYINVDGYRFEKPKWWKQVRVNLPMSIVTLEEIKNHVITTYGSDVGTPATWKSALKCWVLYDKRTNHFPVYIAHCYKTGGELQKAAKVYADLYALAGSQGENSQWYKCYLAYNAGETYRQLNDKLNARIWYRNASAKEFLTIDDEAIKFYADDAVIKLKLIE